MQHLSSYVLSLKIIPLCEWWAEQNANTLFMQRSKKSRLGLNLCRKRMWKCQSCMIKTESSITQQYLDVDSVVLFWGVIIDVFPQYQDDCVGVSETKKIVTTIKENHVHTLSSQNHILYLYSNSLLKMCLKSGISTEVLYCNQVFILAFNILQYKTMFLTRSFVFGCELNLSFQFYDTIIP